MRNVIRLLAAAGAVAVLFVLVSASSPPVEAWYDTDYLYRNQITIDQNVVDNADQDNFPFLVYRATDDNLKDNALDNGHDIVFVASDDTTKLDHEIDNFNGATGELWAWVRIPTLANASDTVIYMYYGNSYPSPAVQENPTAVWDASYSMVHHMNDNTTSTITDSTDNDHDGTKLGANNPTENTSGKIWAAQDFDGVDDYIDLPADVVEHTRDMTIEFWASFEQAGDGDYFMTLRDDRMIHIYIDAGKIDIYLDGTIEADIYTPTLHTWNRYALTWDGSKYMFYVDGVSIKDRAETALDGDGLNVLGAAHNHALDAGVNLDEVRWTDGLARSNEWLRAAFTIEDDPAAAITVAAAERYGGVVIDNILSENALLDNHQDTSWDVVTTTQLQADVVFTGSTTMVVMENVYFGIRDAADVLVDNIQATENLYIADNEQRFYCLFDAEDNAFAVVDLGLFDLVVSALGNDGTFSTTTTTNVFRVTELTATSNVENQSGHNIRTYGEVVMVGGGTLVGLDNVLIEDNTMGNFFGEITGDNWENIRTPSVNEGGGYTLQLHSENLDGYTDNENIEYIFPNLIPVIVSVETSRSVIDNHASDNAPTATTITMVWEDNDNYSDFLGDFWIAVRDAADVLADNENVTSTVTYENENRCYFSWTYDAEDNTTLPNASMGAWDVWGFAQDNWTENHDWTATVFTVDDYAVPIDIDPDNTYMGLAVGFNVLVTGTPTRDSGGATDIVGGSLVDSAEGTLAIAAGASYSENYTMDDSDPGDTVTVTVTIYDSTGLDGQWENTYTVNENRWYEWCILAEDNALAPYNFYAGRTYTIEWTFADLTGEEENVTAWYGETVLDKVVRVAALRDDEDYWRSVIPENVADNLVFYLLQENANRDVTDQYVYTLEDYTGDFLPRDNGELWIQRVVENTSIDISANYWDGDLTSSAWLFYNRQHQYTVKNISGDERIVAFFWSDNDFTRTITIRPITPGDTHWVYDYLSIGAWRDGENVMISYNDTLENTENVTITVYDYSGTTVLYTTTSTANSFDIIWDNTDNTAGYIVEFDIYHGSDNFAHTVWERSVEANLAAFVISPPLDPMGWGNPVPLLTLFSNVAVFVAAGAASAKYDYIGMMLATFIAAFLLFLGWFPISWELIAFLFVISILWMLGSGGRKS